MKLLPCPRLVDRHAGTYVLPARAVLHLDASLPRDTVILPVAERLKAAAHQIGSELELVSGPPKHPLLAIRAAQGGNAPKRLGGYTLRIDGKGILIQYFDEEGLRASVATMRQLMREFGRRLPHLIIRDYPDFAKRGVMLDISRGKVPRLETLMELVSHLADFKINEFQLYTEHTFAYRNYEPVWRGWGAITGEEILKLDAFCRQLGVELVPNQNSFGHLRYWLNYPPLHKLAETDKPWPDHGGSFLRYPSTLAPEHPGTIPFLRELYDELLPHFTSNRINVGCDETWDLGRGQSKSLCEKRGKGRVYVDFLKKIYTETSSRKKQMMFWGDIILHHPELVRELPKDLVALNWGYEANHPFDREAGVFAKSKVPFYVCPGTSTWMTLLGRHDNAYANLQLAAEVGNKHGAIGYLNTDWGDGGHPQPLAVSYLPFILGAAVSWCAQTFNEAHLVPVVNRDVFEDQTGRVGQAANALGFAHRKFKYTAPNITPFGAVIAAPRPEDRELFCRDGLKYYARISAKHIQAALEEVEAQRSVLHRSAPKTRAADVLATELDFAARMAAQSCKYMLWQQALAVGKTGQASILAKRGIAELRQLDEEFDAYWPARNKGSTKTSSMFLKWRVEDYRRGTLHFPPEVAAMERQYPANDVPEGE
ncbi:beta-N-acetylhexosaminidase [Pedosphaera parvula]|uniref:beta-N-acetylhexosaminidase n=1 Tax=Pedosphaera parvula TaxID=1032527 RepID=UPI00135F15CE|nr:family 20 glycosylhydrolase [Pedosphaera parvula]